MKDVIWVVWMDVKLDAWMVGCLAGSWADSTVVLMVWITVIRLVVHWVVRLVDRKDVQ